MRKQNQPRDRFAQYLSQRVGANRAYEMVYSSQKNYQQNRLGYMCQQQNDQFSRTPSQNSIDSSQIDYSNSKCSSNKIDYSNGKTTTIKKRRLRKVRDIQQSNNDSGCSICLQQIKNRATMPCCHSYCLDCLNKWLQTSSRCPYCRNQCQFYLNQGTRHKIQPKVYEPEPIDNIDQGLDFQCYLCEQTNEGDEVLICDRCELYACHIRCDARLRGKEPDQDQQWYCHFCS